ncbi:MAG: cobyrinate a,c-diamide synthase [Sulfuricaulis sp.]|uniref:cobyrinate a,c-diamide synthase n=1 Tax=Sulfuricaulis sp. TaxID=2003553 RepID=UPI003C537194
MNRLLISAAHKSSGKTTLCVGLCAALHARGHVVQPFKKGPDFIDPMWLSLAAGRDCHNLDFYLMGRDEILRSFAARSRGADISLIEGNKGLYDGLSLDGSNSNAALATLLETPVVLVIDARGMTRGIAPLILGYQAFDPQIRIAGVILNQLGGSRHETKLRAVIEHYTDVAVLGAVHRDDRFAIVERHLGLLPSNEANAAREKIDTIAALVAASVDLDRLIAVSSQTPAQNSAAVEPAAPAPIPHPDIRIGIPRDSAFAFYYPGDLEALRAAGAELITIDTLKDTRLPEVDALFIGGGFPEVFMEQLEANASLRHEIRQAIEGGLPAYAECGGLMYLARSITWRGKHCEMAGVIPGDVVMHDRPMGRGYVLLRETGKNPWPLSGSAEVRAHEFHYSSLENLAPGTVYAYDVMRGNGVDGEHDGIVHKNLLACYAHLRDLEDNHWTRRFVQYVRQQQRTNGKHQAAR